MNKLGLLLVLSVAASCEFPRPPDLAPDDAGTGDAAPNDDGAPGDTPNVDDTSCQLTAIGPSIANTDDVITLEGTFSADAMVNFPGGTSVPATVLGPHRARVRVPASATAGELTVTTCGMTVDALPFRRASFTLGVGPFVRNYDQATTARQYSTLAEPRYNHTAVVAGQYLYILGGVTTAGSLSSVERALINADGTLGQFRISPNVSLAIPRRSHTTTRIRDHIYVIGGFSTDSLSSIEHALITPNGALGSFVSLPQAELTTPRQWHTSVTIGNYLYVLGGLGIETLKSIERAVIHADGSLGQFATVSGITLATARYGHTATVIGNYLYLMGGSGVNGALRDVERATINSDGSLGSFASTPGVLLTTARADHAAQIIGHHLYVFGGIGAGGSLRTVERAAIRDDGSIGEFETAPDAVMLEQRHGHTISSVGNHLYILGGIGDIRVIERGEHAPINNSGSLSAFTIVPSITTTGLRAAGTGLVSGNYLYALGGIVDPTTVERSTINADGSLGPFSPTGTALARPRYRSTAAVIGSNFYLFGGVNASKIVERANIEPDGTLGSFEAISVTLNVERIGSTAIVTNGYLYIVGGISASSPTDHTLERAMINPDGSLGDFVIFPSTNTSPRTSHASSTIGDYLYVMGGNNALNGSIQHSVERAFINSNGAIERFEATAATITAEYPMIAATGPRLYAFGTRAEVEQSAIGASNDIGTFTTLGITMTSGRSGAVTALTGNYIYVIGGATNRVVLNSVERAELE